MGQDTKEAAFAFGEDDLPLQPKHMEVRVPAGLLTKPDLLDALAVGLSFPDYFGRNWDALWDCVCDLSWLSTVQVVVIHEDLPLEHDPAQQLTYLSIMNDASAYWQDRPEHKLIVVVPQESEPLVRTLIATRQT